MALNETAFNQALQTLPQDISPTGFNQTAFNQGAQTGTNTLSGMLGMAGAGSNTGGGMGNILGGLLNLGGAYYSGQEDIKGAQQFGQQASAAAQQLGQQAIGASQFKPFTVTTGAGTTTTTPTGGFNLGLSPEQAAMQQQLAQQAGGLFGGVTGDIGQASQDIYSQIRALQSPEEERARLQMQENLFARGRGGISSAQYGGQGAEEFGYNQAQQEAMNQAAFQARAMALSEQEQMLGLGKGLLGQAYVPQQQQLDALAAGTNLANIASTGARTGAELQSQLGSTGLEALLRSYESGIAGEQTQRNQLIDLLLGSGQGSNAVAGLLTGGGGVLGTEKSGSEFIDDVLGFDKGKAPSWLSGLFGG